LLTSLGLPTSALELIFVNFCLPSIFSSSCFACRVLTLA
jgi:hypothetical protein